MTELCFFDTNILLYMYDEAHEDKRNLAVETFKRCMQANTLVISTQVIQEFYVAATRKLRMDRDAAQVVIRNFCELRVVSLNTKHLTLALDLEERYQTSYWDALIIAAANLAGARILYTEDLNNGQIYDGVEVCNPLR